MSQIAMSPAEFEQALRAKGAYYHTEHPFHRAMYAGTASRAQIQGWVANRFYYQVSIPLKDAAIMANCPDRDTRREWVQRILDHDGAPGEEGGIEAWLRLAEAVGLPREQLLSHELVLPGVILPTNDGHPVKRVNYATEVNHDKTIRKEKNIPEAAFAGIQEGSFGTGGKNQHTEGRQGAGAS